MADIDQLFEMLVDGKGSDLHFSTGRVPMMRASGNMVPLGDLPVVTEDDLLTLFDKQGIPHPSLHE